MISAVRERTSSFSPAGLLSLLPFILVVVLFVGSAVFCALSVIPPWRTYETLSAEGTAVSAAIAEQATVQAQAQLENAQVMRGQAANAGDDLEVAADVFWNDVQIDGVLDRLYGYADASSVTLTMLQSPQAAPARQARVGRDGEAVAAPAYSVRVLQLQVNGTLPQLMNFIARLREAVIPSVVVSNLAMDERQERGGNAVGTLRLEMLIYTSQFASGEVFASLPELITPSPVPPTPTLPPPTETPTPTLTPSPSPTFTPSLTPSPSPTFTATTTPLPPTATPLPPTATPIPPTATYTPTPVPTTDLCPGAPPSLFEVGDPAVVDFNEESSLRILSRARTDQSDISTVMQAYDNDYLQLIAGPVCGEWQGLKVWYWNVSIGSATGWVGEASVQNRWLCPADNQECS